MMTTPLKKVSGKPRNRQENRKAVAPKQPQATGVTAVKVAKRVAQQGGGRTAKQAMKDVTKRKVLSHTAAKKKMSASFMGNVTDIIKTMRRGIKASVVSVIAARFGISQEKLFEQLRLPKSTMKARMSKNEILSALEQDRLYRAHRVWVRAIEVLEDEQAARMWINRENRSLGGEVPLALLDTEAGYELVLDTLGRIEYGVVS